MEKETIQTRGTNEFLPGNSDDSDKDSTDFQDGIQRARAITSTWSKKTMWTMFILLYLVSFVDYLLVSIQGALNPYITSEFHKHGLLTAVSVVATIAGGSSTLTLAKIIDIWGRLQGFAFMVLLVIVGLIMKAACKNMETYVAAHTLYWVGHLNMMYCIDIMLADMTTLKNRMLVLGINGTPNIASIFAGPKIADLFYANLNFRWAFGAFAIILVGVCIPVMLILLIIQIKAEKVGELQRESSGRTRWQSIRYYFLQFDIVGIVFITAAFSLILLPFNIAAYAPKGWASGYIIAMEVLGVAFLPAFYVWERFFSPVQFLPWKYLKEPTIVGSCLLYGVMFMSTFVWNAYFSSYLQVVHRLDITTANYVLNAYSLTSAVFSPLIGLLIRVTGEFKWTVWAGIPLVLLGTALLIPFRQPDTHVGVLVMTQILVGLGTCIFVVCGQLAIMAPVTHQEIAAVIAVWGLFGSVGAAVGNAIAGAMWTNIFPGQLYQRLPAGSKNETAAIYADMVTQMSFADGTPERQAVVGAYADVQRKMVITGACLVPLCLACVIFWRNINVKKIVRDQTKGNVF
ncbi:major facilitator superfamily domain-containing protein [Aspergillus ambiguus]|uniref:major facilitator superfamily domain-containing protein n=1 Tax=Aspergillus ambiguus TaxID=176160 RepID=UPI003CCCBEF6